ncbi:conserved hypothetical protein [Verticillium alfalfae VaMs.102]|uniref:Protein kinase domain-containing protein n=1 Tax=Verticillium alfalfae (strain VaMs.102 / ATCC MYA-4576 / FGSC 10136) TaxID=526221 RepID=C9SXD9_VERA1|nr:conserved hypothetical protein [Verticillium alfalfae VaMs.102]EEY23329.1 conserved hypothetical protein [Verticillium alfalfae VaMs.102]
MSIHSENVRISGSKPAGSFSSFKNEKGQHDLPRTVSVNEVFKENATNGPVFHQTTIIAQRVGRFYQAAVLTRADKIDKKAINKSFELILILPKKICPADEPGLTRTPGLYIKTPQLSTYLPDGESAIAFDDGLITGLELVRYEKTLFQRAHDPAFYEGDTRVKTMKTVKEAVCHLHNLGLAYNDLSPLNIMFVWGSSDEPVVLDFDTCHPEGRSSPKEES